MTSTCVIARAWWWSFVRGEWCRAFLGAVGVHGFLEWDAQLFTYRLEFLEVFLVLALVLDFEFDAWGCRVSKRG
jgi:hypothetical protein